MALGPRREFQNILINRRNHGFSIDREDWVDGKLVPWSDSTFIVSGAVGGSKASRALTFFW